MRPCRLPSCQGHWPLLTSETIRASCIWERIAPSADPSYDFKGAPFQFNFRRQVNRTHVVLHDYFNIYIEKLGVLVCGLLVLFFWGSARLFANG